MPTISYALLSDVISDPECVHPFVGDYDVVQEFTFSADVLADNYLISTIDGAITIDPKRTEVTFDSESLTQIYDGYPKQVMVLTDPGSNPCNPSELLNVDIIYKNELQKIIDPAISAGSYTVMAAINEQNFEGESEIVGFTIASKALIPSILAYDKTYDGNTTAIITSSLSGIIDNDINKVTLAYATAEFDNKNAGIRMVTANGLFLAGGALGDESGNYFLSQNFASDEAVIDPKWITVITEDFSKTYGDSDPTLSYITPVAGLIAPDIITGSITREPGEHVNSYQILGDGLDAGANYNIIFEGGSLSIAERALSIKAEDISKLIGAYDPLLTYTVTSGSLAESDEFGGSLEREPGEVLAYPYHIGIGTLNIYNGGQSVISNYNFSYEPGTFYINYATNGTKKIRTYLDCVVQDGPTYYANFRYENTNNFDIYIPYGADNDLIGDGILDNSQLPEYFLEGGGEFTIAFDGTKLTWLVNSLDSDHKTSVSSEASSGSGRCNNTGSARIASNDLEKSLHTDFSIENISGYPNPVTDMYFIGLNENLISLVKIKLVDINGKMHDVQITRNLSGRRLEIDLKKMKSGLYLLMLDFEHDNKIVKVIKQ